VGAEDPWERAFRFFSESVAPAGAVAKIETPKRFVIGGAQGGITEFTVTGDERTRRDGVALLAVSGSTTLLAIFDFTPQTAKQWRGLAYEILNTLRLDSDGGTDSVTQDGISFDYPAAWGIARVRTDDGSTAVAMRASDETEIVIRSVLLPAGREATAATLPPLMSKFLASEMGVLGEDDLADAMDVCVPGALAARRVVKIESERTLDVFAFLRGGAAHFAFISLPGGVASGAYGRAVDTVMSLRGPAALPEDELFAMLPSGHYARTLAFGTTELEAYDMNGSLKEAISGRLVLEPSGAATLWWQDAGVRAAQRGTYTADQNGGSATFAGAPGIEWQLTPGDAAITTAKPARHWYLLPSAH
jgi:hypothetical protein